MAPLSLSLSVEKCPSLDFFNFNFFSQTKNTRFFSSRKLFLMTFFVCFVLRIFVVMFCFVRFFFLQFLFFYNSPGRKIFHMYEMAANCCCCCWFHFTSTCKKIVRSMQMIYTFVVVVAVVVFHYIWFDASAVTLNSWGEISFGGKFLLAFIWKLKFQATLNIFRIGGWFLWGMPLKVSCAKLHQKVLRGGALKSLFQKDL